MAELILASTSPTRRQLMDSLGAPYRAVSPDFDEHLDPSVPPAELAEALALGKARAVAVHHPSAIVIGADQVVAFEGEIWGKPKDDEEARAKLERLSDTTHELITGLAIVFGETRVVEYDVTRMTLYRLDPAEIRRYVATGEWEGCAGGYRVEGRGRALFSRIEGDWSNVLGLPMLRLIRILRELGVELL